MTDAQFELLLAAIREQNEELRAIRGALGRLRGISYALYSCPLCHRGFRSRSWSLSACLPTGLFAYPADREFS